MTPYSQKQKVIEEVREGLLQEDEEGIAPSWHQKALQETEYRIRAVQEEMINWHDAKDELRKRFK